MPATDPVPAHLAWLRMRGLSPNTIYDRSRALARMRAWLRDNGGTPGIQSHPEARGSRRAPGPADDHAAGASSRANDTLLAATEDGLAAWRAALTVSGHTVAVYAGHARGFYAWALAEGLIDSNPAARLPVPRRSRRIPRPVAEEHLMLALASAPPRVRPWLVLAGWCGLRAREIAYLRREDILGHATPPVLLVTEQAAKGGRERMIPLSAFVLAELAAAKLPLSGWAFPRRDGQAGPNAPWLVSKLASEHLHACGVPATLHQLRHRFGTMAYQSSHHDLRAVQELLGHASPATTAGYAAYDQSGGAAAVEGLPCP